MSNNLEFTIHTEDEFQPEIRLALEEREDRPGEYVLSALRRHGDEPTDWNAAHGAIARLAIACGLVLNPTARPVLEDCILEEFLNDSDFSDFIL